MDRTYIGLLLAIAVATASAVASSYFDPLSLIVGMILGALSLASGFLVGRSM